MSNATTTDAALSTLDAEIVREEALLVYCQNEVERYALLFALTGESKFMGREFDAREDVRSSAKTLATLRCQWNALIDPRCAA